MSEPSIQSIPIAEYGMLSDCNSAALVSRTGSVDWLCLPRFDSPAIFSRLLGEAAGHFSIRPAEPFEARRRYLPGTLVLETIFEGERGSVRLLDGLAFTAGQRRHEVGLGAPHELLRLVEAIAGTLPIELEFAPRPEYGLVEPLLRRTEDGGRTFGGPNQVGLTAGVPLELDDDGATLRARFAPQPGAEVGFAMRWSPTEGPGPEPSAAEQVAGRLEDTAEAWRSWEDDHDIYDGRRRELVRLSSRVLKGLTYRATGAVVAAPTTSLPELVGGERNWDYRYAWIRDASLTLEALYVGTCPDEAEDFVSFMTSSAGGRVNDGRPLQIMYGVGGEHDLSERVLSHLDGWRSSRPVRVGNGAWNQSQLDVFGELLSAIHIYRERLGTLHPEIQRFAADLAAAAASRWGERDSGMWEMRGEPMHHLSSKVMCWVALDRAVRLAPQLGSFARTDEWSRERDRIRAAILERGWSDAAQSFTQAFDSDELDAAALLMPLVGFLPASDPRMRSTIDAVERELGDEGLVLRYRTAGADNRDGLSGGEGTFVICSFWLVSCLARAGEIERASALFERIGAHANDLGLLAEEVDPISGEQLGNFPQAFSHVGLINAAWDLDSRAGAETG